MIPLADPVARPRGTVKDTDPQRSSYRLRCSYPTVVRVQIQS